MDSCRSHRRGRAASLVMIGADWKSTEIICCTTAFFFCRRAADLIIFQYGLCSDIIKKTTVVSLLKSLFYLGFSEN